MTAPFRPAALPVAALALGAGLAPLPAAADLSAAQVWEDIQAYLDASDITIETGEVIEENGRLTVNDVALSSVSEGTTFDERGTEVATSAQIDIPLGTITFTEVDGTVELGFPETYPIDMVFGTDGESDVKMRVEVGQPGLAMIAAEVEDGILYDYAADLFTMDLTEFKAEEGPSDVDLAVRIAGMRGDARVTDDGAVRTTAQTYGADTITVAVDIAVPEDRPDPGEAAFAAALAGLSGSANVRQPAGVAMEDTAAFLRAGGSLDVALDWSTGQTELATVSPEETFDISSSGNGGNLSLGLSPEGLVYGVGSTGAEVAISGSSIPLPEITASLARSLFEVTIPTLASEDPQPFALNLALEELELPGSIWDLFDPGAVLERGPISLLADIAGSAIVPFDTMSPESAEGTPELATLDLSQLVVEGAGARLDASGAVTAEEDGVSLALGLPPLVGTFEIDLAGANALLDGLGTIGLLAPEQSAFARGMLGFIAVPTGEDGYRTTLELGADGSLTANGVPLPQ